jgi:hypothetical protein|tara:strand:+ start:808 stop:1230 length:423 start_codon:yes stop_codon:yes gene_type:complete
MTTERRKSPRRAVEQIERTGGWGNVRYHHHLACGHIEVRPRASKAPKLACAWCLRAAQRDPELRLPSVVDKQLTVIADIDESLSRDEVEIEGIRARLARVLAIPGDAIDMVVTDVGNSLIIQSAVVFLSADDVRRIAGKS